MWVAHCVYYALYFYGLRWWYAWDRTSTGTREGFSSNNRFCLAGVAGDISCCFFRERLQNLLCGAQTGNEHQSVLHLLSFSHTNVFLLALGLLFNPSCPLYTVFPFPFLFNNPTHFILFSLMVIFYYRWTTALQTKSTTDLCLYVFFVSETSGVPSVPRTQWASSLFAFWK